MGGKWNNFYFVVAGISVQPQHFSYDDMQCTDIAYSNSNGPTDTHRCYSPQPPRISAIRKPNQIYNSIALEFRATRKILCLNGWHK